MSAAMMIVAGTLLIATSTVFGAVFTPVNSTTSDEVPSEESLSGHSTHVSPLTSLLDEMRSVDGWDLGAGLSLHLDTVNRNLSTKSLLERRALRLDFNGIGVRFGKVIGKDEMDIGFYTDGGQGRGKDKSDYMLPALFGFNIAGVVAFALAAFGGLVMKSLAVAKLAFIIAAYMLAKKLFGGGHGGDLLRQSYDLLEPHPHEMHPTYLDYNYSPAYGTYGYPPSGVSASSPGSNGYLAFSNYGPSGANSDLNSDTSNIAYALSEPPGGNPGSIAAANRVSSSVVQGQQTQQNQQHPSQQQQVQRRRDVHRNPNKQQHVLVNKYTKLF